MPKSSNQKQRILLLQKMLERETDEKHPLSMSEILQRLRQCDIETERRSIYDDINVLKENGLDIRAEKVPVTKYFVAARKFELSEIKLLIDSVAAAKCLPEKETGELIKKLLSLCSKHEGKQLAQLQNKTALHYVKSNNRHIYLNISTILDAIQQGRNLTFNYQYYTVNKELKYRRKGKRYSVTPYTLFCNTDIYYLFAYDIFKRQFRYYRLDRIKDAGLGRYDMKGKDEVGNVPIADFPKTNFSPLDGKVEYVTMHFNKHLLNSVIDRFGKEISIRNGGSRYIITVPVVLSQQFYAWAFRFGKDMQIVSPAYVAEDFKKMLFDVGQMYTFDKSSK